jgi:hypothetical protein
VQATFKQSAIEAYGDLGFAKIAPNFKSKLILSVTKNLVVFWNAATRIFILRTGRENA